jgi:hypothetical protein
MRTRPVLLLSAIFGSAALATVFVVSQLSRRGEESPPAAPATATAPATAAISPAPPGDLPRPGGELRPGTAAAIDAQVSLPPGGTSTGAKVIVFAHETRAVVAQAALGPDGRVTVGSLAPGAYDVRVTAPGASASVIGGVTLVPGARFPLRVTLAGTGGVRGTVRDVAGRPLANVHVSVVQRGDGDLAAAPLEARTDFDGRFRFDGVEVGRAEVVARQDGVHVGASRAVRVAAGRASAADLSLAEPGVLVGRVHQDGRPPPEGTAVVAVAMKAGQGALQVARATADAAGRYRLLLPAGEYRVHAAPGHLAHTDLRVAPGYARIEPRQTATLDLTLAGLAREQGTDVLVLEPGGAPSPGAVVTLARADDPRIALAATTGEDGRLALGPVVGMVGQQVTLRARNGGRTGEETLALPGSGTIAVRLRPGGAVEGLVRGGPRVSGFTVEIASQPGAGGWRIVDVHRFAGDRFELGDLPAEPLRLVVRADDGRQGAAEIRVASGETRSVEIALGR